ncbi:MAG TPA: peptidoglycan-binding domain-containing protein [Thermoleophilaceae bacterium]|nr:peptidoglycan-binding domain-containing protein [Thermoleophilaceae bacterium]
MSRRLATTLALSALTLCGLAAPASASAAAVDGDGMWIWYVSKSSGGTVNGIAAKAARNNVKTVYIKSADGRSRWTQFNRPLVSALKARGLKVCAWQFVYGKNPKSEADRAAEAKRAGADCTVIDAEGHYEGKYVSAQTYMKRLRRKVGPDYEVALTSFPYVHYHPGFPYSVFLGPNGAQANLPQMYWKTIGTSVDTIYRNTWTYNKVYGRPIYPLGQTYSNPRAADVRRFRLLAGTYGARGLSWWVWQFSGARQWTALGSPFSPIGTPVRRDTFPVLKRGYRSDLVVWLQQHLMKARLLRVVNGNYGSGTEKAVRAFQLSRGLPASGRMNPVTWQALLPVGPAAIKWGRKRSAVQLVAARRGASPQPVPLNASRAARRDELAPAPGH